MKLFCKILLMFLINATCLQATVVLSNLMNIPLEHVVVSQTNSAGNFKIQARNFTTNDWRGISQTFLWDFTKKLDGIGLKFADVQPTWTTDQQYVLIIQALSGNLPTSTVAQFEFTLTKDKVAANKWLYINFDDLELTYNQWYGFTLCPPASAVNTSLRAYWATSDTNVYIGKGAQINPAVSGLPKTDAYGDISQKTDFAFYLKQADMPWIYVGNELEKRVDSETHKTVYYFTDGTSIDTHFHYHNGSWTTIDGTNYLFFSSSRNRPVSAGETIEGERQIMAVNTENGDLFYLTTIPNYLPGATSDLSTRPYYASYNDHSKEIYYFNKKRHKIYAYNILTHEEKLILTLPNSALSRELDDYADDKLTRLIYPYTVRQGSLNLGFIAVADFDQNINLLTNYIVKTCTTNDALNHVGICPKNKDVFFYKHHKNLQPDSYEITELHLMNLSNNTDTVIKPDNHYIDHMIWGASGKYIYWDDNQGRFYCYEWETGNTNIIHDEHTIHNQVSFNEKLWVYDNRKPPEISTNIDGRVVENWLGNIRILNCETKKSIKYSNYTWGGPHPRHPHPRFSPDDTMISFVTGADMPNSRIAAMYIEEIRPPEILDFGAVVISNSTTLQLELENLGGVNRTGTIINSSSIFSLTNVYSIAGSTSIYINVTFSPTEYQSYTNIITITGTGYEINDNIEVKLIGSGIPEPKFISCLLLLILRIKANI